MAHDRLIEIVRDLAAELHPGGRPPDAGASLDRAGIDSLARMELALRIEREFRVTLPESAVMAVDTIDDLAVAIARAGPVAEPPPRSPPAERVESIPERARTLVEALDWHAARHPDRPHISIAGETITYAQLLADAESVAAGSDLNPGDRVALMMPTCRDYFGCFFGALLAGAVPVPLYPPFRASQLEEHVRRQAAILRNAGARLLIVAREAERVGRLLEAMLPDLRVTLPPRGDAGGRPRVNGGDPALIQYTSGSTGDPRGVVLSHDNLLANIRAMQSALGVGSTDGFVSWLPLYHDMGLIGAWLGSLYIAAPVTIMPPEAFLARPVRWLRAIDRAGATFTAAPNFAYDICARRIDDADLEGLDLSRWRLALNGAEPVRAETLDRFAERFAPYGFSRSAFRPVYGLAESSVGLVFTPAREAPRTDAIRRDRLQTDGEAAPGDQWRVVSCGFPIPGHEVRVVGDDGRELPDRREGRLQFRGPSTCRGYFNNPDATRRLRDGDWAETGDTAYTVDGEIFVTGRIKDLIIRAGRNIHPETIESAAEVEGVRRGCVAAFGVPDERSGTERVVIVAETRDPTDALRERVLRAVAGVLEGPPDEVVLAPPRVVPKTPSGKIRRAACRARYLAGDLLRPRRFQRTRLLLSAAGPWCRRRLGAAYAGYAWGVFGVGAAALWIGSLIAPTPTRRRRVARDAARRMLQLTGLRLAVAGRAVEPCVLVANHASYLDAPVLLAALPPSFVFSAKRELARFAPVRRFYEGMETVFIERFDPTGAMRDAGRMEETLRRGRSVVVFPEGGIARAPGLRAFRMGAFVAAARAGVPVVPAAIRGTRAVLRADQWYPRRGDVSVRVGPPLRAAGDDWHAALELRRAAREWILQEAGEPDLTPPPPQTAAHPSSSPPPPEPARR